MEFKSFARGRYVDAGTFADCYRGYKVDSGDYVLMKHVKNEQKTWHLENENYILSLIRDVDRTSKVVAFFPLEGCLILEWFEGQSLFDLIQTEVLLECEMKSIFIQLVKTVSQLHKLNVVHNDIKAENVLVKRKSKTSFDICLIDFGLAYVSSDGKIPQEWKNKGSANYQATEKFDPHFEVTEAWKTDIWSLGVLLFVMMEQKYPYEPSDIAKHIRDQKTFPNIQSTSSMKQRFSNGMRNLLESLLIGNPKDRPSITQVECHAWLQTE